MMMNLFSIFDPSTQIYSLNLNWVSIIIIMIIMISPFWFFSNLSFSLILSMNKVLMKEINTLLGLSSIMGAPMILMSLFYFILLMNILGLMPFIFTPTSHPVMTVTLALPLWYAMILFGWINNTQHMMAHLLPQGTPGALMMFMVCIETISNIIRPITLSVRLAANMIAGHLLMTLLGNQGMNISWNIIPILGFSQIMLLMLESAVAMIQAYVFLVLITLYMSETS
uniref:ATP synthase subunit a n=1 Tax=Anaulaciulus koreanus TaxID=1977246 RepID=A0A1W5SZB3_9MYRI|nr:ATP synthase F0 subunit 6 [Anaulaciulus koreanus]ARF02891.1 ATP synthase F0 subunit 6 [Anaulaciulus koreanus]